MDFSHFLHFQLWFFLIFSTLVLIFLEFLHSVCFFKLFDFGILRFCISSLGHSPARRPTLSRSPSLRGTPPPLDRPKFRSFFPLLFSLFLSLVVFSWNPGDTQCTRLESCETPAAFARTILQLICPHLKTSEKVNNQPIVTNFACIQKKKDSNTTETPREDALPPFGTHTS